MVISMIEQKQKPERPASWLVVPVALFLMVLVSVLVPHLYRKRTISRLESLGAKVQRTQKQPWVFLLDRIPGLSNLSKMPNVMIIGPAVKLAECDEIFRLAARLPTLRELELSDSATNDEHLQSVAAWPDLRILSLSNTLITNRGLMALSQIKELSSLSLTNTSIDDVGLESVSRMSQLQELELTGTRVTDVGLRQLYKLKSLRFLGVSNTGISEAAIAKLVKVLPDLQVTDD